MFNIVLVHPEIPHNTGAAGRLCLAAGATLHLVEPLGFSLDEKHVRRVGLDYWEHVDLRIWPSWEALEEEMTIGQKHLCTTKGDKSLWDVEFQAGDWLIFGCETKGLSETIRDGHPDGQLRVPMVENSTRSLNLATTVGIVLFEACRQCDQASKMR